LTAAGYEVSLIEARGILKKFGSLVANDVEKVEFRAGEVHALLGENGAGKSTLCKILYGYYRPDKGEISVDGKKVRIASPRDARAAGIGMVFQTFTIVPAFTVLENVALFLQDLPFVIKREEIGQRIGEFAGRYGLTVRLDALAGQLSAGEQQQVEILKQLFAGVRVLMLDEPTKVLTPQESKGLFQSMAALKASGYAIIFITHKLPEVLACADRITVMRHGRITGEVKAADASEAKLLSMMFEGKPDALKPRPASAKTGSKQAPVLDLRGVSAIGKDGRVPLKDIGLKVHAGEIVGIAGISGNGQRELSDLILGVTGASGGTKLMWGLDASDWSIAEIRARGAASITDDPHAFSSVASMTVRENLVLGSGRKYRNRFTIEWPRLESDMKAAFARFGLPRPPFDTKAAHLSGGNLQRAILTRELARDPSLIVALYPTRGLDVRSASAVRDLLLEMSAKGAALLVVSEELEELFLLSDRIAVLNEGRLVAEFKPEQYQAETIGPWMVRLPELSNAA
jgi:general nucleoside transport system ATP-binding protein